jgi:hypothetical protein
MPRDGLQQYAPPPGTQGVANYTIESARYNTFVADITGDQNNPRPIVAGGTGASDARTAMINLSGEIAKQVVANYDSFPWVNGSFYSVPGATSAPNPTNRFAGQYYANADDSYATVEARDQTTGILYIRNKITGVWGAWAQGPGSLTDTDARYVNAAGDTMTGNLTIAPVASNAVLTLNKTISPSSSTIVGQLNGATRWGLELGNGNTESGSNAGSNFSINRYNDAGVIQQSPLVITRSNGAVQLESTLTVGVAGTTGSLYFGNTGTKSLAYDGINFNLSGGALLAPVKGNQIGVHGGAAYNTAVTQADAGLILYNNGAANWAGWGVDSGGAAWLRTGLSGTPIPALAVLNDQSAYISKPYAVNPANFAQGTYYFGNSGTKYLTYDGTNFNLVGGTLNAPAVAATGVISTVVDAGFQIVNSTGGYARYSSSVIGAHRYQWGADPSGQWVLTDETAGAFRLTVSAAGAFSTNGNNFACGPCTSSYGYYCKQGVSGANSGQWFNLFYSGGNMLVYADNTLVSSVVSDYRVKKDVAELPGMWDIVKALRPISYTHQDFSPQSHLDLQAKNKAEGKEATDAPFIEGDDIERWGFIAHELQETLVDSAATAPKDAPDAIQGVNLAPVVAALTKALQEAMSRIEALEARTAQPK